MRIDGNHNAAALRLVRPPTGAPGAGTPRTRSARSAAGCDALSFDSVYLSKLPRMPVTDAQLRLERLRQELVAARIDVPIHFERGVSVSKNAATAAYARLMPGATALNESATDRAVDQQA